MEEKYYIYVARESGKDIRFSKSLNVFATELSLEEWEKVKEFIKKLWASSSNRSK